MVRANVVRGHVAFGVNGELIEAGWIEALLAHLTDE